MLNIGTDNRSTPTLVYLKLSHCKFYFSVFILKSLSLPFTSHYAMEALLFIYFSGSQPGGHGFTVYSSVAGADLL